MRAWAWWVVILTLTGCAARIPGANGIAPPATFATPADSHVPLFATRPFAPFSREDAVAIAYREWRLFGQPVDDDPPDTRPIPPPELKPEREPGLWQRVGEYWWIGMPPEATPEVDWTGKHDAEGQVFPATDDAAYAWSAAFISYVMRIAGAGGRFPYAPAHFEYIRVAAQMALGETSGWAVVAERPSAYAPQPGDLVCYSRSTRMRVTFEDLPTAHYPGHCAIVFQATPGQISVIGGNVDDAVTLTHVPVTADGMLANPDGSVVDTRYPWLVVLRVLYDR